MLGAIQSAIIRRFIGKIFKKKEDRDPEKEAVNLRSSNANPLLLRQITYQTWSLKYEWQH